MLRGEEIAFIFYIFVQLFYRVFFFFIFAHGPIEYK